MAKQGTKPPRQAEAIEAYASRRRGANYQDAYRAAKRRLRNLSSEFEQAPPSYRSFILVGICTALECHLKYFYGHATERYAGHPEILSKLLRDVSVDISTMISVSTSHFQLSDVVAASVSASSLETYLAKASDFLAVMHRVDKHNFPWDYQKIFTETDREVGKDIALRLDRLREVFVLRHRLVHETDVIDPNLAFARAAVDAQDIADDALWLMDQFEQIYWQSEVNPELNPTIDVPMPEHAEDIEAEIDQVFESIEEHVDERQRDDFQNFKSIRTLSPALRTT
jgi:hypothetical protein